MKTNEMTYKEGAELERSICRAYVNRNDGCGECPISDYCVEPVAFDTETVERKIKVMEDWERKNDEQTLTIKEWEKKYGELEYNFDEMRAAHEDLKERYEKMLDKNMALMKENDELKSHLDFIRTNEMLKERKPDQRWKPIPLTTNNMSIEEQKVWYENSPGTNESSICTITSMNNERNEN